MSRALLIIFAILSAVFAAVLDVTLLYFLSTALILAAAALWLVKMKDKFDIGKPDSAGYAPAGNEDLSSFGILEIRPKARNGTVPAGSDASRSSHVNVEEQASLFASGTDKPEVNRDAHEADVEPATAPFVAKAVRRKAPADRFETFSEANHQSSSRYQMISVAEDRDINVLGPCLESMASAVGANTVAVISLDGDSHRIVAIVSQNAYARGAGVLPVTSTAPFKVPRKGSVTVENASDARWDVTDLKYYRGELAVKELARVLVKSTEDEDVILLVDAARRGVLDTAQSKELMTEYARLIGRLLDVETGVELKPRREIIAEEIDSARADGQPLALALVLHNRADQLNDPEEIVTTEAELEECLMSSSDDLRVERFGDLMFGVFHRSGVEDVEAWAAHLQADLALSSGVLSGGVSVGVAIMTDRHSTPERLRADAAAALEEAVESGACTILE